MEMVKDRTFLRHIVSAILTSKNEGLFMTRTVGEILWGYEDPFLKDLSHYDSSVDPHFGLFYKVSQNCRSGRSI